MKGIQRTTVLGTIAALAAVACGPADDRVDGWTDDETTVETQTATPEVRAQLDRLRSEVESILNDFRAELDELRDEVQGEPDQRLTEVSQRVEETRGEVLSDLERLETADMDEARRIRDQASERIAELEGDVARSDLEATRDAQTLAQRVDRHLANLESDLAEVEGHAAQQPRDDEDAGWFEDDERVERDRREDPGIVERARGRHVLDQDEIENLREELVELREEATRIPAEAAEGEDFESLRDDLSERIADLTKDIKKHWYALKWDTQGAV